MSLVGEEIKLNVAVNTARLTILLLARGMRAILAPCKADFTTHLPPNYYQCLAVGRPEITVPKNPPLIMGPRDEGLELAAKAS